MTHVGERRTVSLDRPNVWLTHLNLAVAQRVCIALLWELSNYRIGFGARFAFCCDFSRVELGFKVLQFVFGDVLPRGMRSAVSFDRPTCYPCPALLGAAHIMLYWSVFDLADRCKLDLKPWKRTIRNQGVNLAGALTKSLSVMRLGCWSSGFGRPSSWPENWECRAGA